MSTFIRFDGAGIQPATFNSLTADGDVATAVLFWLNGGHLFACEDAVPPPLSVNRKRTSFPRIRIRFLSRDCGATRCWPCPRRRSRQEADRR